MGIYYNQEERVFRLDTPGSTYLISIVDEEGFLCHTYYGRRIPDDNMGYLLRLPAGGVDFRNNGRQADLMGRLPVEYPGHGLGDFRESCLQAETPEGYRSCGLTYLSHKIYSGKPALPGLPATYGGEGDCATLELRCHDRYLDLEVSLLYTAFEKLDVICRSARIENRGGKPVTLTAALSACLDMDNKDFDLITLHGSWAYERMVSRRPVAWGRQGAGSLQGISSAEEHPFLALAEHTATQDQGQVYAMHLVYSGNFLAQVEMSQQEQLRAVIGIHPRDFAWRLAPGESFQTPEAVLAYSCTGLDGMTHALHDLYRSHLTRGPWKDKPRPSLVNNWEATYFKFDTEKLLDIARTAAGRGIEMLVLDDGWFGCRDTDTNSLGDWVVNEKKLPGGLKYLADEVNKLGMKFGLWVEPEMVCPDSNLFRAHPDYALQIPGRPPMLSRTQLVLDLSRKEVRDCIYDQLRKVLSSANIEYVKWDMNRPLTDVASFCLEGERQGELFHRYVLGVYELQERMLTDFPHLLLENCASGGGRFDPGMLYYSPQIWTSDNTDAVDRLRIQEGTALIYPLSTMGAHVAACPSHTNGRSTPFETRGLVSLPGCFGYELDLTKLTEEELAMIPGQLENYRKYGPVFHDGDYYRLASYGENQEYDALMAVTKDKKTAVIDYVHVMSRQRRRDVLLPLRGLDEEKRYRSSETGEIRSGAGWMYGGLLLPNMKGDFLGKLIVLEAV
ncbi:MAG: alpha-galactosidase [Oscillospiraceae bacterium]|jgi:alpha-galactosidase|nr:alpha-galactosidase [Oscillospiraceae bacterium]